MVTLPTVLPFGLQQKNRNRMTKEQLNLQSLAEQAAKRDMIAMADQGTLDWQDQRYFYSPRLWNRWQRGVPKQALYDLMPKAHMQFPAGTRSAGLFEGCWLNEIAELVFSTAALEFILQHSYNRYLFWQHVSSALNTEQVSLPLSLEHVQKSILTSQTPFGKATTVYSVFQSNKLRLAIAKMGGRFDIEKLDLPYGFFLISAGLILQTEEHDDADLPKLVLNPMWAEFVASLQAKPSKYSANTMNNKENTTKVKDYPGTGCPICWTRKNLNECIGSQYLTVQELTHMVSHWRTQIGESGFGGAELSEKMHVVLETSYSYFENFSNWRLAHERAELFNFIAEDKSLKSIEAYRSLVLAEGRQFDWVGLALKKIEELYQQLEAARNSALGANPADAKEAEQFAQLTAALAIARQSFDTTAEARQRYAEKASAYAANRKAQAQAKADAKVKASAASSADSSPEPKADSSTDSSPPAAKRTGCGCKKN